VDSRERLLYGEEIVRAALAGRHHVEVMAYLLDWLAFAPAEDRYAVQTLIEARLERVPPTTLERSLRELDLAALAGTETSSLAPARDWLRKAVRSRLTRVALESRDGALARRLLDTAPLSERSGDQGVALERIAANSSVAPRVAGRAVGLLLTLRDSTTRRRSAHAAAGISRALGLPRSSSNPEAVRLITGDDGESADTEQGLLALAGEGAAILVAGVDEASAGAAQRYAEAASIPVILLHAPKDPPRRGGFGFLLGAAVGQEDEILTTALSEQGLKAGIRIGPGGLSCEDRPQAAGDPRFGAARGVEADSLLLLGDAACARDAIAELGQRRARPTLAFGLECAELFQQVDVPQRQLSASTGSFPWRAKTAPDSMRRWKATSGAAPSWYEVLGRDAGQLAMTVLQSFPLDRVDDARAVTNLHDRAQDELARVSVELWSSERRGFLGARTLERKIVVIESAGAVPQPKRAAVQARR
jgi:hypothetical protein